MALILAFVCVVIQVKSRMMGDSTYKSTFDCFFKTLKNEVYFFLFFYRCSNIFPILQYSSTNFFPILLPLDLGLKAIMLQHVNELNDKIVKNSNSWVMVDMSFSHPRFYKLLSVDLIYCFMRRFFMCVCVLNVSKKSSFLCICFSSFILFTNFCDNESLPSCFSK